MSDGWISLDERWPEQGEWVLLACPDGVEQGYQQRGKEFYLSRTDSYDDAIRVFPTHWMPLPDPPAPPRSEIPIPENESCLCSVGTVGDVKVPLECPMHGVLVEAVGRTRFPDGSIESCHVIYYANRASFQQAWRNYRKEHPPEGTYECPICGCATPHAHSKEQIEEWRKQ